MRPTKSDRSDARGLAEMLRMGWYRAVTARSFTTHERPGSARGPAPSGRDPRPTGWADPRLAEDFWLDRRTRKHRCLVRRAEALAEGNGTISGLMTKLAEVRRHVVAQVAALDRDIRRLVRREPALKRFMTVPGVGPITAVAFLPTIDDPERFKHARAVGPYLGLTPTRYQSGETDRHGRISKCGDAFTRTCLYKAAIVLLTKVQRFSPLKASGTRLMERIGAKKARVAVARKIAVILCCIWTDGTEFSWTREEAKMA